MQFDLNNPVMQLCANGMEMEVHNRQQAHELFMIAWNQAADDFEKFTAAHYVARNQPSVELKLQWDIIALELALKIPDDNMKEYLPSLYLNVARCYEDMNEPGKAMKNYTLALNYTANLQDNGYGYMIKSGIDTALNRIKKSNDHR